MAVLGVKEDGWKGPNQYPQILSAVIKLALFMAMQRGLELADVEDGEDMDDDDDDNDFSDSAYRSAPGPCCPGHRQKGCLQFVQRIMDRFMVRGSHGPM